MHLKCNIMITYLSHTVRVLMSSHARATDVSRFQRLMSSSKPPRHLLPLELLLGVLDSSTTVRTKINLPFPGLGQIFGIALEPIACSIAPTSRSGPQPPAFRRHSKCPSERRLQERSSQIRKITSPRCLQYVQMLMRLQRVERRLTDTTER